MNEHIRRRALLATAKVALSFTVMGCGSVVLDDQSGPLADNPTDNPVERPDPDEPPQLSDQEFQPLLEEDDPAELMCQAPPVGSEIPLDDVEMVACCQEQLVPQLEGAMDDFDKWQGFVDAAAQDPDTQACCAVLLTANDANQLSDPNFEMWSTLQPCCQTDGAIFGPTCAPWGPPVPPAMLRALEDLDQLLAAVA